jgi:hypothetical protein
MPLCWSANLGATHFNDKREVVDIKKLNVEIEAIVERENRLCAEIAAIIAEIEGGTTLFHFQNKIEKILFWKWNGSTRATPTKPCLFRLPGLPSMERGITSYCNAKLEIEL